MWLTGQQAKVQNLQVWVYSELKTTLHDHNRRIQKLVCLLAVLSMKVHILWQTVLNNIKLKVWRLHKNKGRPSPSWKSQTSFKRNNFPGFTRNLAFVPLRGEKKNLKLLLVIDTQLLGISCDLAVPASQGHKKDLWCLQSGSSVPWDLRRNRKGIKIWYSSLTKWLQFWDWGEVNNVLDIGRLTQTFVQI